MAKEIDFEKLAGAQKQIDEIDIDALIAAEETGGISGRKTNLPPSARAQLKDAIAAATNTPGEQEPSRGRSEIADVSPQEIETLRSRIEEEVSKSIQGSLLGLAGNTPADRERFFKELAQELSLPSGPDGTPLSPEALKAHYEALEERASRGEEIASLAASGNVYAQMAQGKIAQILRKDIEERAKRIAEVEVTKKFGMLADMRNVPGLSLAEFGGRITIEGFIAYVAYRSAENAVFLTLSQMDATSTLGTDTRRTIAIGVAALASYSALRFRHSIYKSAQDWGADSAHTIRGALKPRAIVRTGFRATMAALVAYGGAIAISKAITVSEKTTTYGADSGEKIRPVSDSLGKAAGIMDGFFTQLKERQQAIVDTERGSVTGVKGAGTSAGKGYGERAAHKDYLFNGAYQQIDKFAGKKIDPALEQFRRDVLGVPDGTSLSDHVQNLWKKSGFEAQRKKASDEIQVLNTLLSNEQGQTFLTRLVKTTLKQVDDPTAILRQVQKVLEEIKKLLDVHHAFKASTDELFQKVNAQGLLLAKAAGQGIDARAPEFSIDISPLSQLPQAPGAGANTVSVTEDELKSIVSFFEKQPGMTWFGAFIKSDDSSKTRTKLILSFMGLYFGIENTANLIFAMREMARRRREKREMPEKLRDLNMLEDKLASEIAFTVLRHASVYADVLSRDPESIIPIVEQLKARIRFFLRSKAESVDPHLSEEPTWSDKWWHRADHVSNFLIDRGPERIRHVDAYITELQDMVSQSQKPKGFVKLIAEMSLPGAQDIARSYDPSLAPATNDSSRERSIQEVDQHMHFLIARIQARRHVLQLLRTDMEARASIGADNVERATKFWTESIMMQLDGTGVVSVGADDARFFETYARLAQEEDADERELVRLASSGRTILMRSLQVGTSSSRITLPATFTEKFIDDSLNKPLSLTRGMTDAYTREIRHYMETLGSSEIASRQLTNLNTRAVPALLASLGSRAPAQEYLLRAEYAYSAERHGPVFRVGIYHPETAIRIGTAEYPVTIPVAEDHEESLAEDVRNWFTHPNPGALEVAARILNADLRTRVEQVAKEVSSDSLLGSELRLVLSSKNDIPAETYTRVVRLSTLSAILQRQDIRLGSLRSKVLSEQQLDLFSLPNETLTDPNTPLATLLDLAPVHTEGVSDLPSAIPQIRGLMPGYEVVFDMTRRKIVVTAPRSLTEKRLVTKSAEFDTRLLYDIHALAQKTREVLDT